MNTQDVTDRVEAASALMLDIETAPDDDAVSYLLSDPPSFDAPGNYKDEAKIAAYVEDKRKTWVRDVRKKAGLEWRTGRVISCAMMAGDGTGLEVVHLGAEVYQDSEAYLLEAVAQRVAKCGQLVTFNGHSFDVPYLRMRMAKHGVKVPAQLLDGRYPTNPNGTHIDVRLVCTGGDKRAKGRQGEWARFLGIREMPTPNPLTETGIPIDGSDITALSDAGEWDAIAAYNAVDVQTLCAMWNALHLAGLA